MISFSVSHVYFIEGGNTMATEKMTYQSTKDLKRVLGRKELMSMAVGQIIGAGIMSMIGIGIAMTGRSINLAFMIAAVITIIGAVPTILVTSCIRMRGGLYTQMALFANDTIAGAYSVVAIIGNMSLSMYALSFAEYFIALVPGANAKVVAVVVAILFFLFNFFGVDVMAKVQNLLVVVLVISLGLFAIYGMPRVDLAAYFSNADGMFMAGGMSGLMTAAAYMGFATGGATVIMSVSAECKNPQKDIPFVVITSTIAVAILYAFVSTVAAGILPVAQVANKPLTLVAEQIFPRGVYVFFIVGGAMFALATTLNSQISSATKPLMQACEDGWFPKTLAELHPKYRTPWKLQLIFFVVCVTPIISGLDIGQISSIVLIVNYIIGIFTILLVGKLPKMFPEQWEKSPFKMPIPVMWFFLLLATGTTIMQFGFMASSVTPAIVIANVAFVVFAVFYARLRVKAGKVHVTVSYEVE